MNFLIASFWLLGMWSAVWMGNHSRVHAAFCTSLRHAVPFRRQWTNMRSASAIVMQATPEAAIVAKKQGKSKGKVPITLLSGFLGSGKTSTLKHLLENTDGIRVGVIVNDVASVNIDAKLVAKKSKDMVQLENGCACCSISNELFDGLLTLLSNSETRLEAVVVELSGVANPANVQESWKSANEMGHPVCAFTNITQIVTLVDATTFGTDWMTEDIASDRKGWIDGTGVRCAPDRRITELLAEQVETANIILVNKKDLAGPDEVKVASSVARGLNPGAKLDVVEFGKVSPTQILGDIVAPPPKDSKHTHYRSHDDHEHRKCGGTAATTGCSGDHAEECKDPDCTDTNCGHSHSHSHDDDSACSDPHCTDTTHSHSHSHATTTDDLGITSFVYKRDRPFHPKRLLEVLNLWPIPVKDALDISLLDVEQNEGETDPERVAASKHPFAGVLRSKGFCWLAPQKWSGSNNDAFRHNTAMYWSHAGKHMGIGVAGRWWASVPEEDLWGKIRKDELERIFRDEYVSEEWGDRRQEVVFIGTNMDEAAITRALDYCLLTESQMKVYAKRYKEFRPILEHQPLPLGQLVG